MLTFDPYKTERSWLWEPLRQILFNVAPPLPKPEGGIGYLVGPLLLPANTETLLFRLKAVSFWAQFALDYVDGRNTDILAALIQTDRDVHGTLTHEISQSPEDVTYTGFVDGSGFVNVSATTTADATLRASVVYIPV